MSASGITIADMLADSGYSYRVPETWALPIRALGADLIQDLHPNDRGPTSTHMGAICANGRLYCPATPRALLDIQPLARPATAEQTATHDQRSSELTTDKLSPITRYDRDGYHRVICPATQGKLRCPPAPHRSRSHTTARRSQTRPSTHPPAAPSRRSPSPRQ